MSGGGGGGGGKRESFLVLSGGSDPGTGDSPGTGITLERKERDNEPPSLATDQQQKDLATDRLLEPCPSSPNETKEEQDYVQPVLGMSLQPSISSTLGNELEHLTESQSIQQQLQLSDPNRISDLLPLQEFRRIVEVVEEKGDRGRIEDWNTGRSLDDELNSSLVPSSRCSSSSEIQPSDEDSKGSPDSQHPRNHKPSRRRRKKQHHHGYRANIPPDNVHPSDFPLTEEPAIPPQEVTRPKSVRNSRFCSAGQDCISNLFLSWVGQLICTIYRMPSNLADEHCGGLDFPFSLQTSESAVSTGDSLKRRWLRERKAKRKNASLLRALTTAFGASYLSLLAWNLMWIVSTWFGMYFLVKWLIEYQDSLLVERQNSQFRTGILISTGLFFSSFLGSLAFHQLNVQSTRIAIRCRGALMVLVYKKSLKLCFFRGGIGTVVNLISNECNRVAESVVNWHYMWSSFGECTVICILSAIDIGMSAIGPILVIFLFLLPLQYSLSYYASKLSYKITGLITQRVHFISELLTAIKLIKFYAWEKYYLGKVSALRKRELEEMSKEFLLKMSAYMVVFIAPCVTTLLGLVLYYRFNGVVPSVSAVFSLLSLYNTLRYPLILMPIAIKTHVGASSSLTRLEDFLMQPEVDSPLPISEPDPERPNVIMDIRGATFLWDGELDHPDIVDLNLTLTRGRLVAVVGDIGSGKSLIAALSGQLKLASGERAGHITTYGTCGYVPQEPWLINASLLDNIIFGMEYDAARYHEVIRMADLNRDFMLLSNGDASFANDLNLSPSQKQKLSLARTLYQGPDIILLENCLMDFDQTYGMRLFKDNIKGQILKHTAIVLVTQQKHFLPFCDEILVLKQGRIVESGTYAALKERKVNLYSIVSDYQHIEDDPSGLLERVNEIRLEALSPAGRVNMISAKSVLARKWKGHGPGSLLSSIGKKARKSSPLVTAQVINADSGEIAAQDEESLTAEREPSGHVLNVSLPQDAIPRPPDSMPGTPTASEDDVSTQVTIKQLRELHSSSMQQSELNEKTVSKLIERNQNSIITGPAVRPPSYFSNQDTVSHTIDTNSLSYRLTSDIVDRSDSYSFFLPYKQYFKEGSGILISILLIVFFVISHGLRIFSDIWVYFLVNRSFNYTPTFYILIYGILCIAIIISVMLRGFGFSYWALQKSLLLHSRALEAVLNAPIHFYDLTPMSSVLSNFAKHLFLIDEFLPESLLQVLIFAPLIVGIMIFVAVLLPYFWATLPVYFALAFVVLYYCDSAHSKLSALEAANKAPMFAHLSSTLEGLFTIRLCKAQHRFDAYNRILIDEDHKVLYLIMLVKRFKALYLDLVACLFIFATSLFIVLGNASPSIAGLVITNALQLLLFGQWFIRISTELHPIMASVSRIIELREDTPREPIHNRGRVIVSSAWPDRGGIEFRKVVFRYHRYGVAVLKSVSFQIQPGENIGIVGRSGSGKSTMLIALLRIAELSSGEILIDDLDITDIGLSDLRSRIAVIPQEPVLLTGTIRSNLDPFQVLNDAVLWQALKAVHLADKVGDLPFKLETAVTENGRAFSLPERQLFCIARAILIKSKIIIFDEPVNSPDNETDALVQSVIDENFQDRTVLILASKFRHVVKTDRIIVMSHGKVVEFDTPLALLSNPKSKFAMMVSQTGDVDFQKLYDIAAKKSTEAAMKGSGMTVPKSLDIFSQRKPS